MKTGTYLVSSLLHVVGIRIRLICHDRSGATGIEYALIVGGISIAILATIFAMGNELNNVFEYVLLALDPQERCVEVGSNCRK